jgi:hypothetical protein
MTRPQITPGPWTQNADTVWRKIGIADQPIIVHPNYSAMAQNDARAIAAMPSVYEAASSMVFEASITDHGDNYVEVSRKKYMALISALTLAGYEF